jgi:uncharacterized repeat protein (TIGR03943 family)
MLLAFLGTVLVRLTLGDLYLRYVNDWMKWPILVCGFALVVVGLSQVFSELSRERRHEGGHGHGVPMATWLLVLPGLVAFTLTPPELGAFTAARQANAAAPRSSDPIRMPLTAKEAASLKVRDFVWRAAIEDGGTLTGREVTMTGFVTRAGDDWFVTRLTIGCCAADALAWRARVVGAEPPPQDQWVAVTGTHVEGTGTGYESAPDLAARRVVKVERPRQPYE